MRLKHRAVLALARPGANAEAARRFHEYRLAGVPDEDVAALRARIAKDVALNADGADRARQAAHAASLYHEISTKTGGYCPAINAATLWLVAGYGARSRELARTVLELVGGDGHDDRTTRLQPRPKRTFTAGTRPPPRSHCESLLLATAAITKRWQPRGDSCAPSAVDSTSTPPF